MTKPFENECIWLIGASSGIGHELAIQLAEQGAKLCLSARRTQALTTLQQQLPGTHSIHPLDVADLEQVKTVCAEVCQTHERIDRVLFFPALYQPSPIKSMDLAVLSQIIDVNLKGALYVTQQLWPVFERQQRGQIALCGSVAGYLGLPNGQPYSATKAALINFAESLHAEAPDYLDVKLINPGFVDTPLTQKNAFSMPMLFTPQQAAQAILTGLNQNRFEIHFPKTFTLLLKALTLLPYRLQLALTRRAR